LSANNRPCGDEGSGESKGGEEVHHFGIMGSFGLESLKGVVADYYFEISRSEHV
jgi:hypothetical protein